MRLLCVGGDMVILCLVHFMVKWPYLRIRTTHALDFWLSDSSYSTTPCGKKAKILKRWKKLWKVNNIRMNGAITVEQIMDAVENKENELTVIFSATTRDIPEKNQTPVLFYWKISLILSPWIVFRFNCKLFIHTIQPTPTWFLYSKGYWQIILLYQKSSAPVVCRRRYGNFTIEGAN